MTDDEWNFAMLAKLDAWLSANPYTRKPLLQHMYMSASSFIEWRETGKVDKATRICWVIFDDGICRRCWEETSV